MRHEEDGLGGACHQALDEQGTVFVVERCRDRCMLVSRCKRAIPMS